jgi:hypothetical protein
MNLHTYISNINSRYKLGNATEHTFRGDLLYIGGYQPAQKWLKDLKDHQLEFDDILHYQKIIVALKETNRLMGEVDGVEIE